MGGILERGEIDGKNKMQKNRSVQDFQNRSGRDLAIGSGGLDVGIESNHEILTCRYTETFVKESNDERIYKNVRFWTSIRINYTYSEIDS